MFSITIRRVPRHFHRTRQLHPSLRYLASRRSRCQLIYWPTLVARSTPQRHFSTAFSSRPSTTITMSTDTESQFEIEGVKLYAKTWTPTGAIKAKLVFVHGYSEHINRYNNWFPLIAAQGIQVFSWDQRGWGRSAPEKSSWGLTGPTTLVVSDVAAFVKDKLAASPTDVPLFVMGHSMGGGEICTLMSDSRFQDVVGQVRGWLLECPFVGFSPDSEPNRITVFMGRLAGRFLPRQQMKNVIPEEYLSRDAAVVQSVKDDPMCHNTGTLEGLSSLLDRTALLASGTVKVGKNVQSLFLAHGNEDKACSYDAAIKWINQQTNVEDKTTKTYEGAYHQLHADHCREEFTTDVIDYIMKRTKETPVEAKL